MCATTTAELNASEVQWSPPPTYYDVDSMPDVGSMIDAKANLTI